jgi:colanic acid/amylovoran biosynthesis glycosyltransferase
LFQANEHNFSDGSEPIIFLTVARLHWIKGLIDTLEALAILKKNRLVFQYNVIGTGLEYESIKFAIHQLDLQNEVQLLGKQNHEAIVEFMEQADIYIQYSFSEGFCNATLEAQAMGLLCIVSDVDGLQENVLHNETGIVVARRQPKLLAKAIENCIVLPLEQKQKLTTGAQKRVKDSFNLEKQQKEFLEFYN